ncbi:MAG: hypothetical protein WBA10_05495 [Elainellaceae cyanobacterium]
MPYRFQFQVIWKNWDLLLNGVWLTLQLSTIAVLLGLPLGLIFALCRTSGNRFLGAIAATYKESPAHIGLRRGEIDLLQWVNTFVYHKRLGGELDDLSQKWLGEPLPELPAF